MSLLNESGYDDQQLGCYLLGLLPEEDAEQFDEKSIVDDEVVSRLRVVEDDLVDAYIGGRLAGDTLERFESFYLSSQRRRQKVRFARSFLGALDRAAAPAAPAPRPRTVGRLWVVAALLLLACGVLLYEAARLRNGWNDAQMTSAAFSDRAHDLEQQLNDQRAANTNIIKELESVRASRTAAAEASAQTAAIALLLLPQTRSIGPIPTLAVAPQADRVALELRLESNDFLRYRVALKDPGTNLVVWRSARIGARTADGPTVSVTIPASVLKAQHYSVELEGLGAADLEDVVASYVFQIVHREREQTTPHPNTR